MEEPVDFKRATACKISLGEVLKGTFVRSEQQQNFLLSSQGEKIRRVNVTAVLIEQINDTVWLLDDGTGKIALRSFNPLPADYQNGDVLLIIAKPRELAGEKYLMPEIVKKLEEGLSWMKLRQCELQKNVTYERSRGVKKTDVSLVHDAPLRRAEDVYDLIKRLDSGAGVDISVITQTFGQDTEIVVSKLLEHGEIFEVRPGRVKILE